MASIPVAAPQPTSGTYNYDPALSDLVLEAYGRCGIRSTSLTAEHMFQARMSAQLLLSAWSVKVPNLWLVTQGSIVLPQGQTIYSLPNNTVTILDAYVRQYQVGNPVNEVVAFSTTTGSTTVSIAWPSHGLSIGSWMSVVTPVSVGGIILSGFYQVVTVTDLNDFTITAFNAATSTVVSGGAVPVFTTATNSSTVTVTLANHGLLAGGTFYVQVATAVSSLLLYGAYTVVSTPTTGTFTFTATGIAAGIATAPENGGLVQFESQLAGVDPIDRVITPISRTDYSAQPDKFAQGFPTVYWFNRQQGGPNGPSPTVTMWNVPDQNGPYVFMYYAVTQIQDVVLSGGTTLNIPFRFLEAFAAGLGRRLARKYAPMMVQSMMIEETMAWEDASTEDTENVPIMITPGLSGYFR